MTNNKNPEQNSDHAKDHFEKKFIDHEDVFADIVNTLLFKGKQRIKEDELESGMTRSAYRVEGLFEEQERDAKKMWKNSSVNIAVLGIENQTGIDPELSIRTLTYDGADYRDQLRRRAEIRRKNQILKKEEKPLLPVPELYPVITLVLYFGEKRWSGGMNLKKHLKIPEGLDSYVSDYKMNLFEISYLDPATVRKFKSDFRFVAEYFVSMRLVREKKEPIFEVTADHLRHVEEFIDLMNALTRTRRFDSLKEMISKGGNKPMLTYMFDEAEAKGYSRGKSDGESLFKSLTEKLLSLGKTEDLMRATKDNHFKEELYKEYNISDK